MSTDKNKKTVCANNNVTQTVRGFVAKELGVKPADVHNNTRLDYFAAMAIIFDLQHKYPTVCFPENKFDEYCCFGTLRKHVVSGLKTKKR